MTTQPDWHALRGPLRSCAFGVLGLLAFLAFWQLAAPGGTQDSNGLTTWAFILMTAACVPTGLGLAGSASRRLWHSGRRSLALVPAVFLSAGVVAFPAAVSAAGGGALAGFCSVLLGFLVSGLLAAYLLVSTRSAAPPAPLTDFNADEPDAYARDVTQNDKAS